MSEIKIVEVNTRIKSQLKKFVEFPNKMYKDVPQFVPAFYGDDMADWGDKNPAYQYCEAKAFLAYKGEEIVGRIGAILSKRSNETWGHNRMRFTQVDFIDDHEVSKALFDAMENWAREKGCTEVHGPLGFCDMDREGMLVEGFDKRNMFITYYNHPYYNEHMTRLGYTKDVDWVEFKINVPKEGDEVYQKIHKIAQRVMGRGSYHKAQLTKHSQFKPYIKKVFELVNVAYAQLYGVVELVPDQIEKYAGKFAPLVNPEYCCLVLDENEELAGFGVCAPSVASAIKKSNGRLFPTGWIGILRALRKNTAVDLLLIAVRPELQNRGINAVIIDHIMQSCIKNGIEYAESGPHLEVNSKVISQWKEFNAELHKRRRCYVKQLAATE
jgi:GNAT superfamily N-acetyltransferase